VYASKKLFRADLAANLKRAAGGCDYRGAGEEERWRGGVSTNPIGRHMLIIDPLSANWSYSSKSKIMKLKQA
jgi:hypothetical protein